MKRLLAVALLELVQEEPLERITVKDISSQAGVGRYAFYDHFHSKDELIYWTFQHTHSDKEETVERIGLFSHFSELYHKAPENKGFLLQAFKGEGRSFLGQALFMQIYNSCRQYIIRIHGPSVLTEDLEYALQFNARGVASQYIMWVKAGMPGQADEQVRFALDCMPQCIKALLPLYPEQHGKKTKSA